MTKKHIAKAPQSSRFIEAAKAAGADDKSFERAFRKVVQPAKRRSARKK